MSSIPRRAKLRTKTGCLTCRQRRKKCDEKSPVCDSCLLSRRRCEWPTEADLIDRRFSASLDSRYQQGSTPGASASSDGAGGRELVASSPGGSGGRRGEPVPRELHLLSESGLSHANLSHGLEFVISRHFAKDYYRLLLLPNCHPGFYDGWLTEIHDLMGRNKSLYYSTLACAASHMHCIDARPHMQELALGYYSSALRELSRLLATTTHVENHNGLLMSIILLYLHGCMGLGTYTDIPRHVNAAARILTLRLFHRPSAVDKLFDRLAVESVIYQIFLVTTGLWTNVMRLDYSFDSEFWQRAEMLLDRSTFFPDQSTSLNSPVLGVPVSLFRLALSLREQFRQPNPPEPKVLEGFQGEVESWEGRILSQEKLHSELRVSDRPTGQEKYYLDATFLYALVTSLMFELLSQGKTGTSLPVKTPNRGWQVRKAEKVLRDNQDDDDWPACFIGTWPVYALGFFVGSVESVDLIRNDLKNRWHQTKFSLVVRFLRDLESAWGLEQINIKMGEGQYPIGLTSLPFHTRELKGGKGDSA